MLSRLLSRLKALSFPQKLAVAAAPAITLTALAIGLVVSADGDNDHSAVSSGSGTATTSSTARSSGQAPRAPSTPDSDAADSTEELAADPSPSVGGASTGAGDTPASTPVPLTLAPTPPLAPPPTLAPTPTVAPLRTLPPPAPTAPPYTVVVESCIDGTFTGWDGETLFELCNGQKWLQTGFGFVYHYAFRPDVLIVLYQGAHFLVVDGVDDIVAVTQITDYIETCIDGDFEGWDGETVFQLCNGQVWQQAEYNYWYHYAYRPDVLIYWNGYEYRMRLDGEDETIAVVRIA